MERTTEETARLVARLSQFLRGGGTVVLRELGEVPRVSKRLREDLTTNRGTERAITAAVSANRVANEQFVHAPFVACVAFTTNGHPQRALICRGAAPDHEPKSADCDYVSYLAPRGRLGALPIGRECTLPVPAGPQRVTVFERHRFTCDRRGGWDAINNVVEAIEIDGERFASLRELIDALEIEDSAASAGEPADSLHPLVEAPLPSTADLDPAIIAKAIAELNTRSAAELAAAQERRARANRLTREILDSVGLRDQATLDEVQDDVFRLPISTVLALTGAPGTGKTTTLIKRIAQKSQYEFLSEAEKQSIGERALSTLFEKGRAWVLFTPNDLLRTYVKDAIGKEGIKTPAKSLRTWRDQQRTLARDVFEIFGHPRSRFVATPQELLKLDSSGTQWEYVDQFERLWSERFVDRSDTAFSRINALDPVALPPTADHGEELRVAFNELAARVHALRQESEDLRRRTGGRPAGVALGAASLRATVKNAAVALSNLQDSASKQIAVRHPELFGMRVDDEIRKRRLSELRRQLLRAPVSGESDVTEDEDPSEIGGEVLPPEIIAAVTTGPLGDLLHEVRGFSQGIRAGRQLSRGIDALFAFVVDSYSTFRRRLRTDEQLVERFGLTPLPLNALEGESDNAGARSDAPPAERAAYPLSDTETDALLFALLRLARSLMESRPSLQWVSRESRILTNLHRELRGLVTVDEAPDFSAVQLGCMYHLSHPAVGAFSMSGDLMQRTTRHGLRNWQECEVFAEGLEIHEFRRVYRQSKRLTRVAAELYRHAMSEDAPFDSPYPDASDPPPLLTVAPTDESEVRWLADRIREIVRICRRLPSIGVFVPSEADVSSIAARLGEHLYGDAIDVQACERGQVLGSGDKVRVFSVQHIKGIEFQAVLMVRLDRLASADADLVDKYLYLGLTRAVEFLGVTVRALLPSSLECVRSQFRDSNWRHLSS